MPQHDIAFANPTEPGAATPPHPIAVHRAFESQVERTPDQVAVLYPAMGPDAQDDQVSYRELNRRANRLAHQLRSLGVGAETIVGLYVEPSVDMVVGMLAILKAGGAYLPLDIVSPPERLAFMLADSQVSLVLTQQRLEPNLPPQVLPYGAQVLCIDPTAPAWADAGEENPPADAAPDRLIYVMYTSGSTGTPKAVTITHAAVHRLVSHQNYLDIQPQDRVAQASNIAFDAATFEVWGPLLHGATVVGVPKDTLLAPAALARHLRDHRISIMFLTTALLNQVAATVPDAFGTLRCVLFGGEAVTPRWVAEVLEHGAPQRLLHMYGPTECTTFATWYLVQQVPPGALTLPIGQAIAGTTLHVLDENRQPVAEGMPGELYIGGAGLARGYLQRPELNAARFVGAPWDVGPRLYRTGDVVKRLPDGNLEFLHRVDQQVKIRGFRIELGEIESTLGEQPGIGQVVVHVNERQPGEKRLVAYYVAADGHAPSAQELRERLQTRLPAYMIPQAFVALPALPLNPNGKVDRRALPEPPLSEHEPADRVAPRTATEATLARIWARLLQQRTVGIHEDFFALGGHSLLAVKAMVDVERELQRHLPVCQFFATPTIAGQAAWLEAQPAPAEAALPLSPVSATRQGPQPLSFPQRQLWLFAQLHPTEPVYNETLVFHLPEPIDADVMDSAFSVMVERHEAFRTTFRVVDDEPRQVIHTHLPIELRRVDLTHLPAAQREPAAHERATAELAAPFDLEQGPLVRATLVCLAERDWRLYLAAHHLVLDGVSMYGVFLPELEATYRALAAGRAPALPAVNVQHTDFAVWQHEHLTDERLADQRAYWARQLAHLPALQLPTDRPASAKKSYRGARRCLSIPQNLTERLKALSRAEGVTLFVTLASAIKTLLHRMTGQEDIVLGTVHAGRDRPQWQPVIGNFLNNLVLRTDLAGQPSFRELVSRVKTVLADAYRHPDLPFEKLVSALQPERLPFQNPLFQVAFVMEPPLPHEDRQWGLSQLDIHSGTSKFDLLFELDERTEGIIGRVEYSSDLFEDSTIARLIAQLQTLLEGIVADPDGSIARLPWMPAAEAQRLAQWNDTAVTYPPAPSLQQLFEAQVARTPQAVALVFEGRSLSYQGLNERANQLARWLRERGVGPDTLVGVCMHRSVEMVIGLYGILKAGGAYLPIDPTHPRERQAFMIDDAQVPVLLTQRPLRETLPPTHATVLCLDEAWSPEVDAADANLRCGAYPTHDPVHEVTEDHLAYAIYTSGSTGQPKGALIPHRGICNRLQWMQAAYGLTPTDVVLQKTPFSFDVSVWEFFWPLLSGARLVVARPEGHKDVPYLCDLIEREQVTTLHFVPSMLQAFLEEADADRCRSLRRVICSGEALPYELQQRFFGFLPEPAELHNLYGPTEASVDVSYWACDRASTRPLVPIGRPIANIQLHILDQQQQVVPIGVAGELHIAGVGLARGYLNRPALTAEKFIDWTPPQASTALRLYRTGDLCRWLPDGAIEYLGRLDHQVKIRGFRIELGEIEAALRQHEQVREVAVIAREDRPGDKRLVAYCVAEDGAQPDPNELRQHLKAQLPEYMVPAAFVMLKALPLSANGKLDRRALPAPQAGRAQATQAFVAPRTPTEQLLARAWGEVLDTADISVTDNFFDIGGDSMRAIRAVARAREQGLDLSLAQLFAHQTIEALSALCQPGQRTAKEVAPEAATAAFDLLSADDRRRLPPDLLEQLEDAYPLSVLQAGMVYHSEVDPGTDVYHDLMGSRLELPFVLEHLRQALQQVVARHPVLRTSVRLTGFSKPLQLVHREVPLAIGVEDLQHLPAAQQDAAIDAWLAQEKRRAFDWETAPLWLVQVHRRSPACFQLTLSFHHILIEGWSIASLLTELFQLYLQGLGQSTRPLPPAPVTRFRDWVARERQVVQDEAMRDHWIRKLADKPLAALPRWPLSTGLQSAPGVVEVAVPESLSERLRQLAQTAQVPFKSVLLAAHLRMLQLHTNESSVTTGLVTNIRPETTDAERVLGLYLNTLPFHLELSGGTWRDLVQATFKAEQADIAHREYPVAEIQRQLGRPLFEAIFNIVHFHVYQDLIAHAGLTGINEKVFQRTNFPLLTSFVLDPRSAQLTRLVMDYDGSVVCRDQAEAMGESYLRILEAMSTAPMDRYERCRLTPAQHVQGEPGPTDLDHGLHTLFEAQARRSPDAIAVVAPATATASTETVQLSYRELNHRANQLAHELLARGVRPQTLIGLCVDRSVEMLVGLLGILKAGCAYVPLDPRYPAARLAFMQDDARVALVVTQTHLLEKLPRGDGACLCLDTERDRIAAQPGTDPAISVRGAQLAYVLYTSGSTGMPKGVAVEHRQTLNFLHWAGRQYTAAELQGVLAATSLNFDLSVFEILGPLSWGGTVIVAENILHLPTLAAREAVTLVNAVPSTLVDSLIEQLPASVRVVNFAGEALPAALVERVYARRTVEKVFNLYGPTEATTYATGTLMARGQPHPVTIGHPLPGVEVFILDEHLQPVPKGVPGELYLGGAGLARGYLNRSALTAQRFIAHPFNAQPHARLYKTGDRARLLPDDTVEYLGRLDRQVKIRGLRIELPEIEAALMRHPAVDRAAVIVREDVPGQPYLAAYVVTENDPDLAAVDLREALRAQLPACMVPHAYTALPALPLTNNGKLDHQALPVPARAPRPSTASQARPRTSAQRSLGRIWADLLGVDEVGIHDNFFDLGGHSLMAMEMIARASQQGLQVTLRDLLQSPTIAALAGEEEAVATTT